MTEHESPAETIERLVAARDMASDGDILAELASLPALADETDRCWESDAYWLSNIYPFLALADVARKRRLRPAVRLLLERACYGDPGEIMRGLRHTFEAIFHPEWYSLAEEFLALARSERLGTRLWAIASLVVLDDPRAIPVFEASKCDDPKEIGSWAEIGLKRLLHPEKIAEEEVQRLAEQKRWQQERLNRQAEADALLTDRRCPACGKPLPDYRRTCKYCGVAVVSSE